MKDSHSILVTIKFTFDGPVTHEELQKAIGRAVNTKQFRLVGQYTILDINDETMVEVPKTEVPKRPASIALVPGPDESEKRKGSP